MKISLEVISGSSVLGVIAGTLDKIQFEMKSDYTCSNIQTLGLAFFCLKQLQIELMLSAA